jgi:small GTP-binding protein
METTHKQIVLGILAHVDSGKTTLSEAMLYRAGAIRKLGRVDHKDAFLDTDALEKARGITIFSKQALFTAGNTDFTLLDTPGHVDFSTETERTLQVLDYAVLVVSGTDGVQSHTETLWRLLRRYHVPTFVFVNKMDLPGKSREELLAQLRPGEDGLILFSGCHSATFLPQVWEQLPEPRQFLAALKHKAGLPTNREVVELMAARYHVEKWKESEREPS